MKCSKQWKLFLVESLLGKNPLTDGKLVSTSLYSNMIWGVIRVKVAQRHEYPTGNISLSVMGSSYLGTEIIPRPLIRKEVLWNYKGNVFIFFLRQCI